MSRFWVGFDVGKAFHWVCVLDEGGGRATPLSESGCHRGRHRSRPLGDREAVRSR